MLTSDDLARLAARGVSADEARRQLELLTHPPARLAIDRPCTVGDGIEHLDEPRADALAARAAGVVARGRASAFVPASGAASRMFRELMAGDDASVSRFVAELPRFAFAPALARVLEQRGATLEAARAGGPYGALLDALLADGGLGYARLPKGLVLFHRTPGGARTAFEEHLVDAAAVLRDAEGICRLHATVPGDQRAGFEAVLAEVCARSEARHTVTFSEQHASTDTLALDHAGAPFRDARGEVVVRPAGHGALIENLARLDADLVFVRNIDNVACGPWAEPARRWAAILLGRLAELEAEVHGAIAALERGEADGARDAERLAAAFHHRGPAGGDRRAWLLQALDRPLRVCGMVVNAGEPGGGPFWVRSADGTARLQIVESAEVDERSDEQLGRFASGTHFNPVFMALGLRDRGGRPFALAPYLDTQAVMLSRKSHDGRALTALERPGLWNGAMAGWNTVFVEVPIGVFNPVKTVFDLLRREHQPWPGRGLPGPAASPRKALGGPRGGS